MPATLKRVRESMKVRPTARNKGLQLTLTITAYDNGMIAVDGIPTNVEPDYDPALGWLSAVETIGITLNEFRNQVATRQR